MGATGHKLLGLVVVSGTAVLGVPGIAHAQAYGQASDGAYCREFGQNIVVDGRSTRGYGTTCLQPDGTWQIVNVGPEGSVAPVQEAAPPVQVVRETVYQPVYPQPVYQPMYQPVYQPAYYPTPAYGYGPSFGFGLTIGGGGYHGGHGGGWHGGGRHW